MPSYNDIRNHTWDVSLTLAAVQRIDAGKYYDIWKEPFSLLDPTKELFAQLARDKRLSIAMIFHVIRPTLPTIKEYQHIIDNVTEDYERRLEALREHEEIADPNAITRRLSSPPTINDPNASKLKEEIEVALQDHWAAGIDGRVLNAAVDAFWQALADFFHDQRTTILKFQELQKKNVLLVEKELLGVMEQAEPLVESDTKKKIAAIMQKIKEDFTDKPGTA